MSYAARAFLVSRYDGPHKDAWVEMLDAYAAEQTAALQEQLDRIRKPRTSVVCTCFHTCAERPDPCQHSPHCEITLGEQTAALREASARLLAELSAVQIEAVREGAGNTNASVLRLRCDELRSLLADTESQP